MYSIKTRKLSKTFVDAGRLINVLSDLSFEVKYGASVAIVGSSGIGKSTLLHILGGIEEPSSGDIEVCGVSFNALKKEGKDIPKFRGENIGFVFQFHHLLPEFSALENVSMPLFIQGINREKANERAVYLLEEMGLKDRLEHRPGMLSGGEQQRVAIARAFANSPKVVLADEPTGNLDTSTANDIFDALKRIQSREGTTLLFVTHSEQLASRMDITYELSKSGLLKR